MANDVIFVLKKGRKIINGKQRNTVTITKFSKKDFVFQEIYKEDFLYDEDPQWLVRIKKKLNTLGYGNIYGEDKNKIKRTVISNEEDLEKFLQSVGITVNRSYGYSGNKMG